MGGSSGDFPLWVGQYHHLELRLQNGRKGKEAIRNAFGKSDRKKFDEMSLDIPRLYISQLASMLYSL
jgi:hypothetical protein